MKGRPTPPIAGITRDGQQVSTPYLQFFNRIVDFVATLTQIGTAANRPAADTVYPGTVYFETDTGLQFISDGVAWFPFSAAAGITQLTGDVTAGPGSGAQAATIANDAVTFAKMQNIATQRLIGRNTAGTGNPEEVSAAQVLGWLGAATVLTATVTLTDTQIKGLPTATYVELVPAPGAGFMVVPLMLRAYAKIVTPYTGINADAYANPHTADWSYDVMSYLTNGNGTGLTLLSDFLGVAGTNIWQPLVYAFGSGAYGVSFTTDWGLVNRIQDIAPAVNQPFIVFFDNVGADFTGGAAGNELTFVFRYLIEAVPT